MFIMDVPVVPAQETPIVLAQSATSSARSASQPDYILKDCQETESTGDPRSAMRAVDPGYMLANYLNGVSGKQVVFNLASIKNITLLQGTTHGKLLQSTSNTTGRTTFHYDPTPDYEGNDRAVFMAEFEGKRYRIVVEIKVLVVIDQNSSQCDEPTLIKVTKPSSGATGYGSDYYNPASVSVTFGDLAGAAVGQTTGTNITLDTNAAANGLPSHPHRRVPSPVKHRIPAVAWSARG